MRNLIREGKVHQIPSVIQSGNRYGMQTMDKHLQQLFKKGAISREEALEYARDEESMVQFFDNNRE